MYSLSSKFRFWRVGRFRPNRVTFCMSSYPLKSGFCHVLASESQLWPQFQCLLATLAYAIMATGLWSVAHLYQICLSPPILWLGYIGSTESSHSLAIYLHRRSSLSHSQAVALVAQSFITSLFLSLCYRYLPFLLLVHHSHAKNVVIPNEIHMYSCHFRQ
jgi:hypothetical protein